ncbi:Di-copper centre-containing protein, partial [Tothia fuscella]
RSLTIPQRKDYIRATQCMMTTPSKSLKSFPDNTNRYDDFKNPFILAASLRTGIHGTGTFLPWHRYAINLWEDALREECDYKGAQPYWDWFLDTPDGGGEWEKSPLYDVENGFGGNGVYVNQSLAGFEIPDFGSMGGGCITNGLFKDMTVRIGPMGQMTKNNTRCITRGFSATIAHSGASRKSLSKVLSAKTFTEFRSWAEMGSGHVTMGSGGIGFEDEGGDLHSIGHMGIGGEMMDPFNSLNDPLFWLHHTGMDRMWSLWQEVDPAKRAMDVGGPSGFFDLAPLKLETSVWVGVAGPDVPAGRVMDPLNRHGSGVLCYKYE